MDETDVKRPRDDCRTRRAFLRTTLYGLPAVLVAPGSFAAALALPDITKPGALLKARVDFKPRDTWSAGGTDLHRLRAMSAYRRITVHHAGNGVNRHTREEDVARDIDGIRGAHLRRRFGDIGYHYAIDGEGRVWEGRSLAYAGAHVLGHNEDNMGIMLLGNFEKQRPSSRQVSSLYAVTAVLRETFNVSEARVYGHRDLGHTLCPGRYLYSYVREMKKV